MDGEELGLCISAKSKTQNIPGVLRGGKKTSLVVSQMGTEAGGALGNPEGFGVLLSWVWRTTATLSMMDGNCDCQGGES